MSYLAAVAVAVEEAATVAVLEEGVELVAEGSVAVEVFLDFEAEPELEVVDLAVVERLGFDSLAAGLGSVVAEPVVVLAVEPAAAAA